MIAPANPSRFTAKARKAAEVSSSTTQPSPAWHQRFLQMMPSITRQARIQLRRVPRKHLDEAVHDVVALAVVGYARLVELDKEDLAYATPLAGYAVAQYRAGRRVGVRLNTRDVLSDGCRRRNGLAIERLDRYDCSSGQWQEAIVEDRRFGPADAAAVRLDFREWLTSLGKRNRQLAEKLATGESTSAVARLFGLSRGRVSQLRRELCDAWHVFQGDLSPAQG